jgi:hypothetical protein
MAEGWQGPLDEHASGEAKRERERGVADRRDAVDAE